MAEYEETEEVHEEESETDDDSFSPAAQERIRQLNNEAKRHRIRAKDLARQLREKDGSETDNAATQRERDALRVENFCLRQATIHGVDADLLEVKLRRGGYLDDPEDLDPEMAEMVARDMKKDVKSDLPKSPKFSGRPKRSDADNPNALARRFPALMHSRNLNG